MLRCAFCGFEMAYVHGHGACVRAECPMRGVNQAECCSGEQGCLPTTAIARSPLASEPQGRGVKRSTER